MLPLPDELMDVLSVHRATVAEKRLKLGEAWTDHDLVFPGEAGDPLDISALRRRHFNAVCKRAGLVEEASTENGKNRSRPLFNLYSLRHTAASLLARAGTHPTVAAALLGHADTSTTLQVYTHSAADLERGAADALAALVRANE